MTGKKTGERFSIESGGMRKNLPLPGRNNNAGRKRQ
jgi:hypothetical protein